MDDGETSDDQRVRGHVYYDDHEGDDPNGPAWYFTVDWLKPDGTRDTSIGSYDYGRVYVSMSDDARAEALRCVHEAIVRYQSELAAP